MKSSAIGGLTKKKGKGVNILVLPSATRRVSLKGASPIYIYEFYTYTLNFWRISQMCNQENNSNIESSLRSTLKTTKRSSWRCTNSQ